MKLLLFFLGGILSLTLCFPIFALDWIKLHEEAEQISLQEAKTKVSSHPDSIENLYLLGLVYLNLHQDEEAEETFRKILDIDISSIPAQWGVAEALRRRYDCEVCERLLNEIIKASPQFWPAYNSLAYLKFLQGEFDETAKLAYKVIKQDKNEVDLSNYVRAHGLFAGSKGMIAHYGGPVSKIVNGRLILPYLKKAQSLKPDSAIVYFGMGTYYLLVPEAFGRDLDRAEKNLKKAIEADPYFVDAYVRLAQVYKTKGDEERYSELMEEASSIDAKNPLVSDIKTRKCKFICPGKPDK
ncbi:MAG: hypothetical protein GF375_01735 [Candidatus Omnitrophica bacterium]|nr:hypothetical protein [Candidatus Omnitrophota bacterium]MBD3268845.1 hypothetical protein [Candidatus Omnitrophota bacterium]